MLDIIQEVNKQKNEIKPKTTKSGSLPRKQNKKLSQNHKKWVASGFVIPKLKMNCYFYIKNIQIL